MRARLKWDLGAQTLAPEQLCSHGEQCCKAPVHGKINFTCTVLCANCFRKGELAQTKLGTNMLLLLAAQPSHSQTKHEFQIDDIVY